MLHNELSLVERLTGIYKPPFVRFSFLLNFYIFFLLLLKLITKINFLYFLLFLFFFRLSLILTLTLLNRKLPFVKAHPILLSPPQQTNGICQQRLNVQQQPRGQRQQPPRHEELGQQNHPFIIPQIRLMVEAEIILVIVMETIQFMAVVVPHIQQSQQHVVHHHRHRVPHSIASSRV